MSNITRFDPFTELGRFDPFMDIDDVVSRFMMRPFMRSSVEMEPQIKMDVKEMDGEFRIEAEIPGVKKDDIHVAIDGRRVSIVLKSSRKKKLKRVNG